MAIADTESRQDNSAFECGAAQIRAHQHHLATVVHIRGEIDAANAEGITDHIRRFTRGDNPVVLDVADVSHFAEAGISLLQAFDADCRSAGVEWTLVASSAITTMLDGSDHDSAFPIMRSVHEALQDRAEAIVRRRRLVLPLVRKMP